MRVVKKVQPTATNTYMMASELSGAVFVGINEPNVDRHFMLTAKPKHLVDLINGSLHPLNKFGDDVLFNKVDGTLTID